MTNKFNKVLAVFLSIAGVAFLGFTIAFTSGGVNWESEMRAPDLDGYNFQLIPGEIPKWEVKGPDDTGKIERTVASVDGNKLSEALVKTRKDLDTRQKAELAKIRQELPLVEQRLAVVEQSETADREALKKREAEAANYLSQLHNTVLAMTDQLTKRVQDTNKTRTQAANRRKDVYRLTNELEVLRTDRARLVELRRILADELLRTQLTIESLQQRVDQSQGAAE